MESNLRSYLQVLRRRFPWIIGVAVVLVVIAVGLSSREAKQYSATAQLLVQPAGSASSLASGTQQTISPTGILTELQLLKSAPVSAKVEKDLGFSPPISTAEVGQTNVITVTATAQTPALAAKAANTYAKVFVQEQQTDAINELISGEHQYQAQINALDAEIQALDSQPASSSSTLTITADASQEAVLKGDVAQLQVAAAESPGGVEVVSPASAPLSPSSPKPRKYGEIALVLGLLLGVGAAFLVDYFDDTVYAKEEVERLTGGVPVLAQIPKVKGWKKGTTKIIAKEQPFSPITETYRSLRTSLQFAGRHAPFKTILVTSTAGGDGKTSTAANLGVVIANAGKQVVIVGCDLLRPRIGAFFGLQETPGLTSLLLGHEDDVLATVQAVPDIPGLSLLGTGPIPAGRTELLGLPEAGEILRTLAELFDVVIIDSPPLPVADALVLSSYADAIVLIVAAGETKTRQVEWATELLRHVAAPRGIVLNKVIRRTRNRIEYSHDYRHQEDVRRTPEPFVVRSS